MEESKLFATASDSPNNKTQAAATDLGTANPRPNLWIHVLRFGEGMASWKMSFTFLLGAAKHLGATLVEPCIQNGRLHSCAEEQNQSAAVRFRHVFDLDKVREVYPYVASYEEFVEATNYTFDSNQGRGHLPSIDNTFFNCLSTSPIVCGSAKKFDKAKSFRFMYDARNKAIQATTLLEISNFDRFILKKWTARQADGNYTQVMNTLGMGHGT